MKLTRHLPRLWIMVFLLLSATSNLQALEQKAQEPQWIADVQALMYDAPDSALAIVDKVLLVLESDQHLLRSQAFRLAGIAQDVKGNYMESLANYNLSMDEAILAQDSVQVANILLAQGIIFHRFDNFEKALNLYVDAKRIFEQYDQPKRLMAVLNNIGSLYNTLGLFEKGLEIYREQIKYGRDALDSARLSSAYTNIAHSFFGLEMLDSAVFYNREARRIDEINNNTYSLLSNLPTAGAIYVEQGKLDSAEFFYRACLQPVNGVFLSFNRASIYAVLSQIQELRGDVIGALALLDTAIVNLEDGAKSYISLNYMYNMKAQLYFKMGEYKKASEAAFTGIAYRDSLENEKVQNILTNIDLEQATKSYKAKLGEAKHENESLESINQRTSRLLYLSWTVGILLIAFIIALYLALTNRSKYLRVTNQKNQELTKNIEVANRMISVLAHDFRTPLSGLLVMTDWLQKGGLTSEEIAEFSNKAQITITKSLSSIDELLYYITRDKKLQLIEEVSVIDVINEVNDLNSFNIRSKNIEFTINLPGDLKVKFDRTHLLIIARNLISNSVKFLSDGGVIKVYTKSVNNSAVLVFEDNGPGISDDMMELISSHSFEAIRPDKQGKGLGLGLQLVYELAEMNNAKVSIKRLEPQGTRVEINFST